MSNDISILDELDPEISDRVVASRRAFFSGWAGKSALVAASVPLVLAAASTAAFGQSLPKKIVDVLNFALTLEYLEAAFYAEGNKSRGLIPSKFRTVFRTIGAHEKAHVKLLQGALGSAAVAQPAVDFTAGGTYPDVFENFETFLTLAVTFEDLGVAAYKGQAGNLAGNDAILTTALQIHSVEARHASEVRRISGKLGWNSAFDKPLSKSAVLKAATPFLA